MTVCRTRHRPCAVHGITLPAVASNDNPLMTIVVIDFVVCSWFVMGYVLSNVAGARIADKITDRDIRRVGSRTVEYRSLYTPRKLAATLLAADGL